MTDEDPSAKEASETHVEKSVAPPSPQPEPTPLDRCVDSLQPRRDVSENLPDPINGAEPSPTTAAPHEDSFGEPCEESAEAVPTAPDDSVAGAGLAQRIESVLSQVAKLQASFDEKIRYDQGKEEIIDRQHAEIQAYKGDLALKTMKPLVMDLINLYDDIGKVVAAKVDEAKDSEIGSTLIKRLAGFQEDIEDVLDRHGFEPFCSPEREFDPQCQRVLKKIPTNDESLHRVVVKSLRRGFCYEGRVIRPEMVAAYIYQNPENDT